MANDVPHISVCICTFKRPRFLERLLGELANQKTDDLFTYSIVVVDNDALRSAECLVSQLTPKLGIPAAYCVEPQRRISVARNLAVSHSTGDFIAFIDDDEFPESDWLLRHYTSCKTYGVAGVLGPVLRHFDEPPPKWILRGQFYQRPRHSTGFVMPWQEGRTGNVLLRRRILGHDRPPFDSSFHRGEDVEFFRRMIRAGHVFIWCDEAIVYEVVPPVRWARTFLLRRALLRGTIAAKHDGFHVRSVGKSVVAVPIYAVALPFALVLGHHHFMTLMVKLCDHMGKLMALARCRLLKNEYVTD